MLNILPAKCSVGTEMIGINTNSTLNAGHIYFETLTSDS